MNETTFFVFVENSPLNNPDNGNNPTKGYVSSNRPPGKEPGEGEPRPVQVLEGSNCETLSEKTTNDKGTTTMVSWMMRQTVNEYGAVRLPPKN